MRSIQFLSCVIGGLIALAGTSFGSGLQAQESVKSLSIVPASGPLKGKPVYAGSHALLIGVNRYPGIPGQDLQFALNDVRDMAEMLVKSYGFPPKNVRILTDSDATLAGIRAALIEMTDSNRVGPEDRVLVYFSGHGQTVKLSGGGEMGFLIPHDAKVNLSDFNNAAPYLSTCLPMSQLWDYLGPSAAKHILVIADACYSGLLAKARGRERISEETLAQLAVTRARQVMTAGQKGQVSYELAAVGHGAFTGRLLEKLKARAAVDDVFTTAELHTDVQVSVSNLSKGKQQPVLGDYETEGQFLWIPVAWTGPQLSAQELITGPAKKPHIPETHTNPMPQTHAAQLGKKPAKLGNLEINLPPGWECDNESNRSAGLFKPELKDAGTYLKFYFQDISNVWRQRVSSSWFEFAKQNVDSALRTSNIVEDTGYTRGKTPQGLDITARKTTYKESPTSTICWDYYVVRSGASMVIIYVKYRSKDFYKTIDPEIQQILNGLRFS